jgi:hypothetical protein
MKYEDLGGLVTTAAVHKLIEENDGFRLFVTLCLGRYLKEDWGDLPVEDRKLNDEAVTSGEDRILASYRFPPTGASWNATNTFGGAEDRIWIITEWDRSVTTILFPSEY